MIANRHRCEPTGMNLCALMIQQRKMREDHKAGCKCLTKCDATNDRRRASVVGVKKRAATHRPRGGWDEGSILRTTFFAYKNKKATLYLSGFLVYLTDKGGQQQVLSQSSSVYLITLSARWSRSTGIVRSICFAALRLMTNSNFVACCTGKSAGLAPFKILST
jgi:hypothetical protein